MSPFGGMLAVCFQQTVCPLQSLGGNNILHIIVCQQYLVRVALSSLHDGGNNFGVDILRCNSVTAGKIGKERRMV